MIHESDFQSLLNLFELPDDQIGGDAWWKVIYVIGTPFVKQQYEQNSQVLFIWQDPMGNETKSSTASVLLDVNSVTNHHSWTPTKLNRVPKKDVWFGLLDVDSKWRGSYAFIPIKAEQLPEIAKEKGDGSRESQRAWLISILGNKIPDTLNTLPSHFSGWGMSSALHLAKADVELGWQEWDTGELESLSGDQVHPITWSSTVLENQRDCSVFSTANFDAPLVILLDGQKWDTDSGTLSVLKYLTDTHKIAPAHYLLLPSIDGKTRAKELSCDPLFWKAVVDDLLPKVQIQLLQCGCVISDYLVAGQSLGGLSALYAGIHFPHYFSKVITLSGSFWWPEADRMRDPDSFKVTDGSVSYNPPQNSLADQIMRDCVHVMNLQVYQTVGLGEKNMCLYNDMTYQALRQKGASVDYEQVSGGHDWLSWRSGLVNGLLKLIPATAEVL